MDMGKYLISIITAAQICGTATSVLGSKGSLGAAVKFLAGSSMTLSIIAPWGQLRLGELSDLKDKLTSDAERVTLSGQNTAREAMAESIINSTRTYILDKAESLGAELTVEVMLDDSQIPIPNKVRIRGNISPYNREKLSSIIERDLGIPTEAQIWT